MKKHVLILGASYGSLLGTKLLMAGHSVTLVCTGPTARLIEREGTRVRFPVRGLAESIEVASKSLPGKLRACTPAEADPAAFDLVVLAMQEGQYRADGVRHLMQRVAASGRPCMAIMNMPPLSYLWRIGGLAVHRLRDCYTSPDVWEMFDPDRLTLASPDPQAFRPADEPKNVLQVGLPTNFKVALFESATETALLRELERDIDAARYVHRGREIELPVRLKVHESTFVPLAKWPMLITGNYRCVLPDGAIPIGAAVHADPEASRRLYQWTVDLCLSLGAESADLVPFEKYARAAEDLVKPSSVARALLAGAQTIERVDRLVQRIAVLRGQSCAELNEIVRRVDDRILRNRACLAVAPSSHRAPAPTLAPTSVPPRVNRVRSVAAETAIAS